MNQGKIPTLVEKIEILVKANEGDPLADIAIEYGIEIDTVTEIVKNAQSIVSLVNSSCFQKGWEKPHKNGRFPQMEEILFEWCCEQPQKEFLTRMHLHTKALEILTVTNEKGFGRPGVNFGEVKKWATDFRTRFGIQYVHTTSNRGQKAVASGSSAGSYGGNANGPNVSFKFRNSGGSL